MTTDTKQIARRFIDECWNQGKLESIGELVSANCRIHDPVFPALTSGADNLKRHIGMCKNGFPDLKFSIDDTIAEGKEVVHHWTARGTHKAEFLGMQPTNRNATVSGTSIYRIEGDKIVEQWADWNLMSLMEQLGVGKAPSMEAQARDSSVKQARA
ncbi:ester cyclase [Terriglobus albidus]|uniref:Ester cyclase n=1 Tax=Terriglobus albidus TaxID=1592106 RepID=A0A5B9E5P0_9BACT|nr:ester cyclase [Terriglobus albidus]QEE27318.1 ester cyclase [Terriglobus albidus]